MSLYKNVVDKLKSNKEFKNKGKYLGIPYPFPKLNEYLSSINRGEAIGLLSGTGVGKSKLLRYIFVYHCFKFYIETGYKLRILYFCMEDSKEMVYNFIICNYLKEYYGITITSQELQSKSRELPTFVLERIIDAENYFKKFEEIVTIIDGETEPTRIYNICKEAALSLGKVTTYNENIEGKIVKQYKYESDVHCICLFDNQSNIDSEDGTSNEQASILKFIKDYVRLKLCNFFKFTCVIILQKDFDSEKILHSKTGDILINRLEGGLADIGDSKRAARSLHLIFSLFSPQRYDILKYPIPPKDKPELAYNIDILGNRFRSMRVVKSNSTDVGMRVPLIFDAIGENFTELPPPGTEEMKEIYNKIGGNKFQKSQNVLIFDDEKPF